MIVVEIIGAIASVITIFTAGVAVGRYISSRKNDRRQIPGKIERRSNLRFTLTYMGQPSSGDPL